MAQAIGAHLAGLEADRELRLQPDQPAGAAAAMPVGDPDDVALAVLRQLEGSQLQIRGVESQH